MKSSILSIAVLLCISATVLWAQNDSALTNRLLRSYRLAQGAGPSIQSLNSIRVSGTTTNGEAEHPFELVQRISGEIRYKSAIDGAIIYQTYDGTDAWRWVAARTDLGVTRLFNSMLSPLQNYKQFGFDLRYLGLEPARNHAGTDHHFELRDPFEGDIVDVWVNSRTLLETRRAYRPEPDAEPVVFLFADYVRHDGIFFPMTTQVQAGGTVVAEPRVAKIETNVGPMSFYFSRPSGFPITPPTESSSSAP